MIKKCNCEHPVQDQLYGKGMRVHTEGKKDGPRCTVCGGIARWMQVLRNHAANHNPKVHG